MSCIHYKFRNNSKHDTIQFDGSYISVGEIKQAIINQKKIGRTSDFSLQIINAQTNEEYKDDNQLIPRNADVTVRRVPTGHKVSKSQLAQQSGSIDTYKMGVMKPISVSTRETDLSKLEGSEEEKLKILMKQQSAAYETTPSTKKSSRMEDEIPLNYICHRCGRPGHLIKHCPTNGDPAYEHRRPMQSRKMNLTLKKAEKKPEKTAEEKKLEEQKQQEVRDKAENIKQSILDNVPVEYKCPICDGLMVDACLSVCCGQSFCDECIREKLLDDARCPSCWTEVYPNELAPNKALRSTIDKYKKDHHDQIVKLYSDAHIQRKSEQPVEQVNPAQALAALSLKNIPTRNTVTQAQTKPEVVITVEKEVKPPPVNQPATSTASIPQAPPGPVPAAPPPPVAILPPKPPTEEKKEEKKPNGDNKDVEIVQVKEKPKVAPPPTILPQLPKFPPVSNPPALPPLPPLPTLPGPIPVPHLAPVLPGPLPMPPVSAPPPGLLPPPLPLPEQRGTDGILNQEEFYAIQKELRKLQRRRRSNSRSPRRRTYSPVSREHSKSPRRRSSHRLNKRRFNRPPYDRINRTARFQNRDMGPLKRDVLHSRIRGTFRTKTLARRVRDQRESSRLSDHREEGRKSDGSDEKSYESDKDRKNPTEKRKVYRGNRRTPDNLINSVSINSGESNYSSQEEKQLDKASDKMITKFDKGKDRRKKSKKHKKKQKKSKRGIAEGKALTMYSESPSSGSSTPDFPAKVKSPYSEEFNLKSTTIAPPKVASPSPVHSSDDDDREGDRQSDCSRTPDMSKSPRGEKCLTPQLFNGAGHDRENDDSVSLRINDNLSDQDESDVSSVESFDEESKSSNNNLEELRRAYKEKQKEIRLLKKERADAKARRKAKKHKKKEKKIKEEKTKKKKKKSIVDMDDKKTKRQHKRSYQHVSAEDEPVDKGSKSSKRSKHSKREKTENGSTTKDDVQFKVNITPIKNMPKSPNHRKQESRRVHINVTDVKKSSRSSSSSKSHRKSSQKLIEN